MEGPGAAPGPERGRWGARRGAERGAEQILREIGPFTAGLSALQRGHTPRAFPSGAGGSGCLLFRDHAGLPGSCPAHGFAPPAGAQGAGAPSRAELPPRTSVPGLPALPGGSRPNGDPVQPTEERGVCGARSAPPALGLNTLCQKPRTFTQQQRGRGRKKEKKKRKKRFFGRVSFPRTACGPLQAPDPEWERSAPCPRSPSRCQGARRGPGAVTVGLAPSWPSYPRGHHTNSGMILSGCAVE